MRGSDLHPPACSGSRELGSAAASVQSASFYFLLYSLFSFFPYFSDYTATHSKQSRRSIYSSASLFIPTIAS